jgi:hypothetical protein
VQDAYQREQRRLKEEKKQLEEEAKESAALDEQVERQIEAP